MFLRDLCQQMAKAVCLLHKQGIYHGRLHPDQIRFVVDDAIYKLTEEEMNTMIGDPYLCQVRPSAPLQHPDAGTTPQDPADHHNTNDNPSLPANVPPFIVIPTSLGVFGLDDDPNPNPYVMCAIALADLDACTQHTP